jgi:hypothetical protein
MVEGPEYKQGTFTDNREGTKRRWWGWAPLATPSSCHWYQSFVYAACKFFYKFLPFVEGFYVKENF